MRILWEDVKENEVLELRVEGGPGQDLRLSLVWLFMETTCRVVRGCGQASRAVESLECQSRELRVYLSVE